MPTPHASQAVVDREPLWWNAPVRFFVETLVGLFIFGVIASAAVGLHLLVALLSSKGIDSFILVGLKGAEYALFGADLILFGRFLWKTTERTWRAL